MSDQPPPIKAYMVTLAFHGGQLIQNCVLEASEAIATASATHLLMSNMPINKPLVGVAVMEMTPEWLRTALNAIETGRPSGQVISLVPQAKEPEPETYVCPIHDTTNPVGSQCPGCAHASSIPAWVCKYCGRSDLSVGGSICGDCARKKWAISGEDDPPGPSAA